MRRNMKEIARLVLIMAVVSAAAGYLLATTHELTKEPIAAAEREEFLIALRGVLPEYDNEPDLTERRIEEAGRTWVFYVARKGAAFAGCAFRSSSDKGYGSRIEVLVGVRPDGAIQAIEILKQRETPGLGANIAKPEFTDRFAGRDLARTEWRVRGDGGDIQGVTGATISSRAVLDVMEGGKAVYRKHAAAIRMTEQR